VNKTKIEWVKNPDGSQGYNWNPITGCLNGCEYCYARKLANGRLFKRYTANNNYAPVFSDGKGIATDLVDTFDPFYPRFWPKRIPTYFQGKPRGVFVCDMSDLFGAGIPEEWTREVLGTIKRSPNGWRFYLLTKQPQNLIKFSPFPDNCFVGVSATNWLMFSDALGHLATIEAKVKYISFEPLLGEIKLDMLQEMLLPQVLDWVIIGAQTNPYRPPKIEWVTEIIRACDKAGIPVFIKDNLRKMYGYTNDIKIRQEMPTIH